MPAWTLKGCPRCGGDTFKEQDLDGVYEHCLLCGFSREVAAVPSPVGWRAAKAVASPGAEKGEPPPGIGVS